MAFKYSYRSPAPQPTPRLVEVVRTAHSAAVQPPIALRELDFIEPPPRDYFCPVSFDLLLQPQQTKCCGNHLSLEVTTRLQKEGKPCPMCNSEEWSADLDKYHSRRVHQVRVRCWYKDNGCGWEGDMNEFKKHANSCDKRPWECEYCGLKCTYGEGEEKHWPICPKFPLPCPNGCEVGSVERCGMEQHRSVCPLEPVACEMKEFGCSVVVPRKELATHMRESELQHLTAMTALNLRLTRQLQQDAARLDQAMAQQQRELEEEKKKIASLQAEALETPKKLEATMNMKLERQKSGLTSYIQKVEHTLHHMEQHTENGGTYVVCELQRTGCNEVLYTEPFYSYHHGYKFRLGLFAISERIRSDGHILTLADFRRMVKDTEASAIESKEKYEEHKREWEENELQIIEKEYKDDEEKFVAAGKKKYNCSIYSQRMRFEDEFKIYKEKQNTEMGKKKQELALKCSKNDFNSHQWKGGSCSEEERKLGEEYYKMNSTAELLSQIRRCGITVSSYNDIAQHYIHVFLQLMDSEYDESLQWPVEVRVQLELLNQAGDNHHLMKTKNMTFTREERGKEDGYLFQFCTDIKMINPLKRVNGDVTYIMDYCLKFRITITVC